MYNKDIDIASLRKDLADECAGVFFAGGFGGGIIESTYIQSASDEEIIKIAIDKDINLAKYSKDLKNIQN